MPIFYQQDIDEHSRLAVWKIEEEEGFFLSRVPLQRSIVHPHKRLQHLAGRYLLTYLFPELPLELIQVADTRKPFFPNDAFHFSISHCSHYAAVVVSRTHRVGVDVELATPKVERIRHKFVTEEEWHLLQALHLGTVKAATLVWSCKEAGFKWYGKGSVDFRGDMVIQSTERRDENRFFTSLCFKKEEDRLLGLHSCYFDALCLSYVME